VKIKNISKLKLKRIIKEEINNVLSEQVRHVAAASAADMVGRGGRDVGFPAKANPNAAPKKFIQNFFKAWSQAWYEGLRGEDYNETMDVMKDAWKDLKQGNERKALNDTWVQLINVGLGDIATGGIGKALWVATKKAGMHEDPEIQEWIRSRSISPIVHDYDEARQMGRELTGTVMSVAKKVGDLASGFAAAASAGEAGPGGVMAMKAGIPFMQENKDVNGMKIKRISKLRLKRIIKEEVQNVLAEQYQRTNFVPADQSTEAPEQKCERLILQKLEEWEDLYPLSYFKGDAAQRERVLRAMAAEEVGCA